jgi:hypothetical protein
MGNAVCAALLIFGFSSAAAVPTRGCPETVEVPIATDSGSIVGFFSRRRSLHGQASTLAAVHLLLGPEGCNFVCVGGLIAEVVSAAFVSGGCNTDDIFKAANVLDFLQVGAHVGNFSDDNGDQMDPVFKFIRHEAPSHITLVAVEPLRSSFEKLVANYAGAAATVSYEHAAIVPDVQWANGERAILYAPAGYSGSEKAALVSSLLPTHGDMHGVKTKGAPVPTLDWRTLLRKHGAIDAAIGTLLIDAEGLDCVLLFDFPWESLHPDVVVYEHSHCGAEEEDMLHKMLLGYGYRLAVRSKGDMIFTSMQTPAVTIHSDF